MAFGRANKSKLLARFGSAKKSRATGKGDFSQGKKLTTMGNRSTAVNSKVSRSAYMHTRNSGNMVDFSRGGQQAGGWSRNRSMVSSVASGNPGAEKNLTVKSNCIFTSVENFEAFLNEMP